MITEFNKPTLCDLRPKIEAALVTLGEEFGVKFTVGSGSYADIEASFKLNINLVDESGEVKSVAEADFLDHCGLYDLQPDDLGAEFTADGVMYKITGLNRRAQKFRIKVARVSDGKVFGMTVDVVVRGLRLAATT